jgi:hypothetical protein
MYQRLNEEAQRRGKPIEATAEALLAERLAAPIGERERATEVLRAAGLLAEPGPEMQGRAARSTATLAEVQAALAKGTGKTLSEIMIEQRGPKL